MSKNDTETLLSFQDFIFLCRKGKKKIILWSLGVALIAFLWQSTYPVIFKAEATFREKNSSSPSVGSNLMKSFMISGSGGGENSEAISHLTSRTVLEPLVQKLSLQGRIISSQDKHPYLKRILDNIRIEKLYLMNEQWPVFQDEDEEMILTDITYHKNYPLILTLSLISDDEYKILEGKNIIGSGKLGTPFSNESISFTLTKAFTDRPIKRNQFQLLFLPQYYVIKSLKALLKVETDKKNKNLLVLNYRNPNRKEAVNTLNALMETYREHLKKELNRISTEQLGYLYQRQNEMSQNLTEMMDNHAQILSEDLTSTGFADTGRAMQFLASNQENYKNKLMNVEFEIKRLKFSKENRYPFEKILTTGEQPYVNNILSEIRNLKTQCDVIDLSLKNSSLNHDLNLTEIFNQQMTDLKAVQLCSEEAKQMLNGLEKNNMPPPAMTLFANPKYYLIKTWYEKLSDLYEQKQQIEVEQEERVFLEWNICKDNFMAYLNNLIHLLHVQEKTIQERLAHQQTPQVEFQGISLPTTHEMYINFCRELNSIQSQTVQYQYIVDEIQDPHFEVSSLSAILTDPVSRGLVEKASLLALALKDRQNRSDVEKQRLKEELSLQKGFLMAHLQQTIQLNKLRENLLKEKTYSLQQATLELLQQQISILEKHLADHVNNRLEHLYQEQSVIQQHQQELKEEMAKLPKKWASEKLLNMQMEMYQGMARELFALVESKNTSSNLEVIISGPLDDAAFPVHPESPHLLLLTTIGALLGAFIGMSLVVVKAVTYGVDVSEENLKLAAYHVSGSLSSKCEGMDAQYLSDHDLATLRNLISYLLNEKSPQSRTLLILKGQGFDFSLPLISLLTKMGLKVCFVPLNFNTPANPNTLPGLLQYLEGKTTALPTRMTQEGYDEVSPGGISRFAPELLSSKAFTNLLNQFGQLYDWTIVLSDATFLSAEGQSLLQHFSYTAVNIRDEKLEEIKCVMERIDHQKISFLVQTTV